MKDVQTRRLPTKIVVLLTLLLALLVACENPTGSSSNGSSGGSDPAATTPTTDGDSGSGSGGGTGGDQTTSQFMAMVRVDGGVMRSSWPDGLDQNTTKPVEVSSFHIGTHEVTQEQYFEIMGNDARQAGVSGFYDPDFPSEIPPDATQEQIDAFNLAKELNELSLNLPMYDVSWFEAIIFANRLSIREGLTPVYAIEGQTDPDLWGPAPSLGSAAAYQESKWTNHELTVDWDANGYRLPTNAEWSWAAMGGVNRSVSESAFSGATGSINDHAWHNGNTPEMTMENPFPVQPVGTKQPNALGIYDMSGNVWEWVWDWHFNWRQGLRRADFAGQPDTPEPKPVMEGPVVPNYRGDYPTSSADLVSFFDRRRHKIIRGGSVNEVPTSRQFAADLDMTSHNAGSSGRPIFQDGNSNTHFGLTFPYVPTERYETIPGNPEGTSVPTQYIGFRVVRNAQ